jgi:anaerobic magnesium-protoporphyrin IX monomethyl ester cyclase
MITLINHQGLKSLGGLQLQSPAPSIGLAYLGAYLKQHGLPYTAIDACGLALDNIQPYSQRPNTFVQGLSVDDAVALIPANTKVIGFSCLFSHCWPLVEAMAKKARQKFPNALFIAGGEHPTALPESALLNGFDVVVVGEGEETLLELATKFLSGQNWNDTTGIAYLANGKVYKNSARVRNTQIDTLPLPDWDNWCIRQYIQHKQVTGIHLGVQMPILGSRGCPYACKFCSNEGMWTRRYIMRDPKLLVDEMELFKNKYGVTGFTFMDSTFVVQRSKILQFAHELCDRNLNLHYQLPAGTRCEAFDQEVASELARSGLRSFAFAIESGDAEMRKIIRKQMSEESLVKAVKAVKKTKMASGCFFVIGFPEDTKQTMQASLRLIRKLAWLGVQDVTISKFTPYPGSDYFSELEAKGAFSKDLVELDHLIDFYSSHGKSYCPAFTQKQLYHWMLWFYLNFYILSFLARPHRTLYNLCVYLFYGVENTKYARLLGEILVRRLRWRNKVKNLAGA